MFLDPDPRPHKHTAATSGSLSSKTSISSLRDSQPSRHNTSRERTKYQRNSRSTRRSSRSPEKPTVRLVKPSPAPESPKLRGFGGIDAHFNFKEQESSRETSLSLGIGNETAEPKSDSVGSDWSYRAADSPTLPNEAQTSDKPSFVGAQLPSDLQLAPIKSPWHRRSTSSGYVSESSTLKGSEFAFSQKSRKSERLSQGTTARGTPPPSELEFRGRSEDETAPQPIPAHALQTLPEASPERPTIRAVTPSIASSPPSRTRPETWASDQSHVRSSSATFDPQSPSTNLSRPDSRRTWSTGSAVLLPMSLHSPNVIQIPELRSGPSEESLRYTEAAVAAASSPNFVAYSPDPEHPRASEPTLRDVASIESINSRLHTYHPTGPDSGRRVVTSPSFSSQSSNDTLPSLRLPRKRWRHVSAQTSLGSQAGSSYASRSSMSPDDTDTFPYRRQAFLSQLSTIASVSDQPSRATSQQMSHFSLGSAVSAIEGGSRTPPSGLWPSRQHSSEPAQSPALKANSSSGPSSSGGDEPGDMTLGIFREESAKPPPLFTGDSTMGDSTLVAAGLQQNEIPLMVLQPESRDGEGDETVDTLTALQTVPLRQKWSGYSLRQRSNSTPSTGHSRQQSWNSYVESDRWSYGSSIFPTWAKHYYGGTAVLSSKVSLPGAFGLIDRPAFHSRHNSAFTERSVPSRLDTGYSNVESISPGRTPFLPSIFRPRTAFGFYRHHSRISRRSRSSRMHDMSHPSSTSNNDSRPDSMAILPDPLPSSIIDGAEDFPPEQSEWETVDDELTSPPQSRVPRSRRYEKQRQWNDMEYPRPMTQDQMAAYDFADPHLAPSRRNAQPRLTVWRPPSFVESLDTLIHSRCNRQILLFGLGFLCPLLWMLGAALPLPKRPMSAEELGQSLAETGDDGVEAAMAKHEAADSDRRWLEERTFLKARWWRVLNRVMSVVGLLVIGAVIALAVVATH